MKWTLIEESGCIERAWDYARHYLDENQNVEDVMMMSLPVNSFKMYEFQIDSSILLRDLIFTVRPIVAWARSLRVDTYDENNIFIDKDEGFLLSIEDICKLNEQVDDCIRRVANGEKKDYVKEDLPLLTETHYSIKIDFRTLMNLLYTFECINKDYFKLIATQVLDEIKISYELYNKIKKSNLYDKLALSNDELTFATNPNGNNSILNMHIVAGIPSANIMAQFIRQHSSIIKNGLWNLFNDDPNAIMNKLCICEVPVLGYLDDTAYKNLLTTRTCWFAQYDKSGSTSWDSIIGNNIKSMSNREFLNNLPCHGKCTNCKIKNEMIPRCDGRDQNIPCPIFTENPYMIDKRFDEFQSTSAIMHRWLTVELDGLIKLNMTNEYNTMYQDLQSKSED